MIVALALSAWLAGIPSGSVAAVTGCPGTGKSRVVKEAAAHMRRVVVFDPHASRDRAEEARGHALYPWQGDLWPVRELLAHPDALDLDPLRLVVDPAGLGPEAMGAAFAGVGALAWRTGGIDLVAEEAALYSREAVPTILRLASGGRHAGVRLYLFSQSLGRLALDARRHLSHLICFAQAESNDLDDLRRRCGRDFAARVARLTVGDPRITWQLGQHSGQESAS